MMGRPTLCVFVQHAYNENNCSLRDELNVQVAALNVNVRAYCNVGTTVYTIKGLINDLVAIFK